MPEHTVGYPELDGWKPPKDEQIVAVDPNQDGAWKVTTVRKSDQKSGK